MIVQIKVKNHDSNNTAKVFRSAIKAVQYAEKLGQRFLFVRPAHYRLFNGELVSRYIVHYLKRVEK